MGISKAIMTFIANSKKQSLSSYVNLEVPLDSKTYITDTGSLVTLFKVHGMLTFPVANSCDNAFSEVEKLLNLLFKDKAHKLSWCFERDKSLVGDDIDVMLKSDRASAKRLNLDIEDVFEEVKRVNQEDGLFQRSFLALETTHAAESKIVLNEDIDVRNNLYKEFGMNIGDAPNPFKIIPSIINRHNAKIDEILNRFSAAKINVTALSADVAASVMGSMLDPVVKKEGFIPHLAFDAMNYKRAKGYNRYIASLKHPCSPDQTLANYVPQKLAEQLCSQAAEEVSEGILKIGSRFIAPLLLTGFPKKDVIFNGLLREITPEIPFRINFLMGHPSDIWFDIKKILVGFTKWGHPDNEAFAKAVKERNERQNLHEAYCSMQIVFVTWGSSLKEAIKNREQLITSIEKWEGAQVKSDKGDPYESFVSSVPGAKFNAPSVVGFPPVSSAVGMLPVTIEGKCWDEGMLLFRTHLTKQISSMVPLSDIQDYHLDVILASPRQGKGILSNSINLALLVKKGNTELPMESFVDVGPTSTGYGKFIQDSLPDSQKHLVEMMKIKMGDTYYNPADIQFGLDMPLPEEKGFLRNFLLMIVTDPSTGTVPANMSGFIGAVIDETYKQRFSFKSANIYVPYVNKDLDEAIKKYSASGELDLEIDEFTKYFHLRDALFKLGEVRLAKYCHTMSMPLLSDFREVADSSDIIARDYGALPAIGSMSIPDYFALKIKEATNKYSIFTRHSNRDFESAKIKIIDVKPMIDLSNAEGLVQTGIFMLLARFIACKDFVLNEDHPPMFPKLYRDYQKSRILKIRALPKRVTYDELHTTNTCKPFRNQLQFDVKEGPKWNTSIAVISHDPGDFGDLLRQATNLFVLGRLPAKSIKELDAIIGLSEEAKFVFNNNILHGPRKGGSSFYLRTVTKSGIFEQVYRFPKGPIELWSYTTEKRDMPFRDRIISKVGTSIARRVLSTVFPKGTAEDWFVAQEAKMVNSSDLQATELDNTLVDKLEEEILHRLTDDILNDGFKKLQK